MKDIVEVAGGRIVPEWLDVDAEKLQGTVKDLPTREQSAISIFGFSKSNTSNSLLLGYRCYMLSKSG